MKPDSPASKPASGSSSPTGTTSDDLIAVVVGDGVAHRVEVEGPGESQGDDRLGRRDEGQRGGEAVVALGEVAVVRGDDGVDVALLDVVALPLADARSAGVGQHRGADPLEVGQQAVALDGGPDLLGAGGDHERRLAGQSVVGRVAGDAGGPGDVLVGRVGARAHQRRGDLDRPALRTGLVAQVGDGVAPGRACGGR